MLEVYADLEYQRRHLVEQKTPKDREMVMAGVDRLLDQMLDSARNEFGPLANDLPDSEEGRHYLTRGQE